MSRVGRLPVTVPAGVEVNIKDHLVEVKGPKGKLSCEVHQEMQLSQEDNKVFVIRSSDEKQSRALHGLTRTQNVDVNGCNSIDLPKEACLLEAGFFSLLISSAC
jgi:ribosomal protein L6P/L9E